MNGKRDMACCLRKIRRKSMRKNGRGLKRRSSMNDYPYSHRVNISHK
jgi:hypothetical protein